MRIFNCHYQNKEQLKTFVKEHELLEKPNLCIQIFCGVSDPDYIGTLIDTVRKVFPGVPFIGTTTSGEIIDGQVLDRQTVMSFACFDRVTFKRAIVRMENSSMFELGQRLGNQLIDSDTKALIMFSGGDFHLNFERSDLLKGVQSVNRDIMVAGGVAGNYASWDQLTSELEAANMTYVFTDQGVSRGEAVVGLSLSGSELIANNGCNLGWRMIGKKMTVSDVVKQGDYSRVLTLDGIPTLKVYTKYFGKEFANSVISSALEFSFVMERDGLEIAATPIHVYDDHSILYAAELNRGDIVQFGFGHPGLIINRSSEIAHQVAQYPVEALFIYSCATRQTMLSHVTRDEIVPFQNIAPIAGFLTFGEFYHHRRQHLLIGQTMTILALSETAKTEQSAVTIPQFGKGDDGSNRLYNSMTAIHTMIQRMTEELEDEKHRSERLLLNILPESIANQLRERVYSIAESFSDVTVLFADIVGFTDYSASHSADQVVQMLNEIFSLFDLLTEKFGLEKIKTIGDAYMIAGGIPLHTVDHTEKTAMMAVEMMRSIAKLEIDSPRKLRLRIGIHSGPVVAGVLGTKKFAYDLWGDTVNTASRMESHGIPGKIQVTEAVYLKLKDKFTIVQRGFVEVKGKGEMKTYFLEY